ncbi:MAG: hypothetical protein ICV79_28500, partial [Flavisolibacter sp.]|nr:hypothetical protein [Flavisolibacter sp.]
MKKMKILMATFAVSATFLACQKEMQKEEKSENSEPIAGTDVQLQTENTNAPGNVYTLSNQVADNRVIVYNRSAKGLLTAAGSYSTGGTGTGAGLGSQVALTLSESSQWLFAVNAGSNDVSIFKASDKGLTLTDKEPSGGIMPVSITNFRNWVYVLNAGGAGSIAGFYLNGNGTLTPIPNSIKPLSSNTSGPAQISFNSNGTAVIVTEKATSKIITYNLNRAGVPGTLHQFSSASPTPFGFA